MRVLFITCHVPCPAISGGRLREYELLRRVRGHEVRVVAVSKVADDDRLRATALGGTDAVRIFAAQPGTETSDLPEQVRRHASTSAGRYIADAIARAAVDLVHVEGFYLMHLVPQPCPVPVVLGAQNVEHSLWQLRAANAVTVDERARLLAEAERTRQAEVAAWRAADACIMVTDTDADVVRDTPRAASVTVVPDGVPQLPAASSALPPGSVAFVGNFAYEPNVDGARFLLDDIVPRVRARVPDSTIVLVGNNPPPDICALAATAGVRVTGAVRSVAPYVRGADVIVCPLRVGGGVKVKMLEAIGAGRAIVTTSIGAQGLDRVRNAYRLADDAKAFAASVVDLLTDPGARRVQEMAARRASALLPTWDEAADALRVCYDSVGDARAVARPA